MRKDQNNETRKQDSRWLRIVVVTLALLSWSVLARPAYAACAAAPWNAANKAELAAAIDCYNATTATGTHTINFTDDITLTAALPTINNTTADVALTIQGADFALDGNSTTRGFNIAANTSVTIDSLTIRNGRATTGAGIQNSGTLTVSNSTISDNAIITQHGRGGGIYSRGQSTLVINQSTISGNEANIGTFAHGGGIYFAGGELTINNSVVRDSKAKAGGGIASLHSSNSTLTINNSTVSGNQARYTGGAIMWFGAISLNNSVVSNNWSISNAGGLSVRGSLTVQNSTLTGNTAVHSGGAIYYRGDGGSLGGTRAVDAVKSGDESGNRGVSGAANVLLVSNSTLSGNSAGEHGGAIFNIGFGNRAGTATINNSTLSGNSAEANGGGIYHNETLLTVSNSIIANNTGADCFVNDGTLSVTHSLVEDGSCGAEDGNANNNLNGDPLLSALADNGGPSTGPSTGSGGASGGTSTQTYALLFDSPAIEAADNANCPATDQRGNARPQADTCDIGAVEFTAPTDCTAGPWNVASAGMLNDAIACYNATTASGTHTINVTDDITLTAALPTIDNTTANVSLAIQGAGFALDANSTTRGFHVAADTHVIIDSLTIRNGITTGGTGGGIHNDGILTIRNSTISNSKGRSSGAIDNSGTLTVENSTLSGNESTRFSGGAMVNRSMATIVNSTISGNTSSNQGGGLYNASGATLVISHTTVTDNQAASGAGGITSNANATETRLYASIVASNNGSGSDVGLDGSNSTYVSDGYNLIGTKGNSVVINSAGDQVGVADAKLGALADNGSSTRSGGPGSTQTHVPLSGSPAIDAANNANCPAADQRGESRPTDGNGDGTATCDIGAVEAAAVSVYSIADASVTEGTGGSTHLAFTITRNLSDEAGSVDVSTSDGTAIAGDDYTALTDETVNFAIGELSQTVNVAIVTDGLNEADETLTVTLSNAVNGGIGITTATGTIEDDDVATLTLVISAETISEADGAATATVTRNTDTTNELVVNLASNDTGEATVPSSVTIFAGEASATFDITAVDDADVDGTQVVQITASATDFVDATDFIDVVDDERAALMLEISAETISESDGAAATTATVTRNTDTATAVTVNLASDDTSEATVPSSVTIAAGQLSATFDIAAVDDAIADGTQTVEITASATDYVSHSDSLDVTDNECTGSLWQVNDEATLNTAVACFNMATVSGTYVISFTNNISLTAALPTIDNDTSGASLTIEGNGHALDGQNSVRLFTIYPSAPVQIRGLTMMNGSADAGGAIENSSTLTIENSTLVGNQSTSDGGAIINYGQLTVRNSTISENSAANGGGGVRSDNQATIENSTIANNTANTGAGIQSLYDLSVVNSTISGNTANTGGGLSSSANATLINSTISGNTANAGGGGGLFNASGTLVISHTTIADNHAVAGAGGISSGEISAETSLYATIVARNTGGNDLGLHGESGIFTNTFGSQGYNLVGTMDATVVMDGTADQTGVADPLLGALADYGPSAGSGEARATQTHALLFNSPAIDSADNTSCPATDQRNQSRRNDHTCDIGAFELQFADSPTVIRNDLPASTERTFGPTRVKLQWAAPNNPGTITITKRLEYPHTGHDASIQDGELKLMWDISADVETDLDVTAVFCYTAAELATMQGGTEGNLTLYHREPGQPWSEATTQLLNLTDRCITAVGITAFSEWMLMSSEPLAITLSTASAEAAAHTSWVLLPLLLGLVAVTISIWRPSQRNR